MNPATRLRLPYRILLNVDICMPILDSTLVTAYIYALNYTPIMAVY